MSSDQRVYRIFRGATLDELEKNVSNCILRGWIPVGAPFQDTTNDLVAWYQAIYLPHPKDGSE